MCLDTGLDSGFCDTRQQYPPATAMAAATTTAVYPRTRKSAMREVEHHVDDEGRIVVRDTVVVNQSQHSSGGDAIHIGRTDSGSTHIRNGERGKDWGNPHSMRDLKRDEGVDEAKARQLAVDRFEKDLRSLLAQDGPEGQAWRNAVKTLQGDTLVCYCAPKDCHGRILAEWAERFAEWA